MANNTTQKCQPNVALINNELFWIDESGNCRPLKITIAGNVGPKGARGPAGVFNIPTLTTAQRLALVPTKAYIVQDSDLDEYFYYSTISNEWRPF